MAIFKNFNGDFFDIPDDELQKFKITDEQAREKLKENSVDGAEVGDNDDDVTGQGYNPRMHQRTL